MGWVYLVVACVIGAGVTVQGPINAQLRLWVGEPLRAAFVSILTSLVSIGLVLGVSSVVLRRPWPAPSHLAGSPWWVWIGGILGAAYVVGAVVLVPRLGAALLLAAAVVGQMIASLLLDHFGLVGLPVHPVTPGRLLGAALLAAGVVLIRLT